MKYIATYTAHTYMQLHAACACPQAMHAVTLWNESYERNHSMQAGDHAIYRSLAGQTPARVVHFKIASDGSCSLRTDCMH